MKKIIFIIFISIFISYKIFAQKSEFVRVFNTKGQIINKGHISNITDTSVVIQTKQNKALDIPLSQIGSIRTKRAGHNTLLGVVSVASIGVFAWIAHQHNYHLYSAYHIYPVYYPMWFSPPTSLFDGTSKRFVINQQKEKLKLFQSHIHQLYVKLDTSND